MSRTTEMLNALLLELPSSERLGLTNNETGSCRIAVRAGTVSSGSQRVASGDPNVQRHPASFPRGQVALNVPAAVPMRVSIRLRELAQHTTSRPGHLDVTVGAVDAVALRRQLTLPTTVEVVEPDVQAGVRAVQWASLTNAQP